MGSSAPTEQTSITEPWSGSKPHVLEFLRRSEEQSNIAGRMYPLDMTTGPGQLSSAGLEQARGMIGLDTADQVRAFAGEAMGGFASNPMLDQTYDAAARGITRNFQRVTQPGIESAYARAGRGTSSASGGAVATAQEGLAASLGDLSSQFYYTDYERRMGDRFRGAALMGSADQMEAGQIGILGTAGAQEDAYSQQRLNELIQRYNFQQQEPQQRLDQYGQRIGAISQGYSSTTTTGIPSAGGSPGLAIGLGLLSALATVYSGGAAAAPMAALMAGGGIAGGLSGGGAGGTAQWANGGGKMAPIGGF
jgi:hypothetical protein